MQTSYRYTTAHRRIGGSFGIQLWCATNFSHLRYVLTGQYIPTNKCLPNPIATPLAYRSIYQSIYLHLCTHSGKLYLHSIGLYSYLPNHLYLRITHIPMSVWPPFLRTYLSLFLPVFASTLTYLSSYTCLIVTYLYVSLSVYIANFIFVPIYLLLPALATYLFTYICELSRSSVRLVVELDRQVGRSGKTVTLLLLGHGRAAAWDG